MSRRGRDRTFAYRLADMLSSINKVLPPLNFITIHYAYFVVVCLISSVVFWASSNPSSSISYVDSLFLVVSAMSEAGLNTVNLSTMTTWQQTMLFMLIMLGSTIWVSIWTVLARKHVFQQRFNDIVRTRRLTRPNRFGSSMSFRKSRRSTSDSGVFALTPDPPILDQHMVQRNVADDIGGDGQRPKVQPVSPITTSPQQRVAGDGSAQSPYDENLVGARNTDGHIVFADLCHPRQDQVRDAASRHRAYAEGESRDLEKLTGPGKAILNLRAFLKNRASGQHSEFHDLSNEEREHLGGCEYRALNVLAVVVPLYFVLWQLLACIALGAWMDSHMPDVARQNGINPWWLGIFNGVSAFNNSGMSLLDANMVPFQNAYFVLITMGLLILAGNTAYPLFLRLFLWASLKVLKATSGQDTFADLKIAIEFILKYPRRVYTNLFPSRASWWLLFMLVCLNSVDWALFELLNLRNPVVDSIPRGPRVLVGLFQALAVRSGGFYVVPISQIAIGVQFLYVIMMYISVYPVVITMRHSNVYEERSLGIYHGDGAIESDNDDGTDETAPANGEVPQSGQFATGNDSSQRATMSRTHRPTTIRRLSQSVPASDIGRALQQTFPSFHGVGAAPRTYGGSRRQAPSSPSRLKPCRSGDNRINFIQQQIHGQLAHDIWWLVLAVFVITAIETPHFDADPIVFSVFNIILEVVSAYGTVGISAGVPTAAYSFSGAWYSGSKLVLCLVMLRGRHRGLPVALDHAVRLPGERLHRDEEEDHQIRRTMSESHKSLNQ